MKQPKRITGFMPLVKNLVYATPGLTAQEIYLRVAQLAEDRGIQISAASNPEASLMATLHKTHGDFGLERNIGRDGRYVFYPIGQGPSKDPRMLPVDKPHSQQVGLTIGRKSSEHDSLPSNVECCIKLPPHDAEKIGALVVLGQYSDEHEAYCDLVKKGLESTLARLSG